MKTILVVIGVASAVLTASLVYLFSHHPDQAKNALFWTAFGSVATAVTAIFIFLQLVVFRSQLSSQKENTKTQNLIAIFTKLEVEREARAMILKIAKENLNDPSNKWSELQRDAANVVAATFNVAGIFVKKEMIDQAIAFDEWRVIVPKSFNRLKAYIRKEKDERGHEELWQHFEWLKNQIASCFPKDDPNRV